ncbi:MAG: hypothetical protein IJ796_00120 [Lachnospiraceae bacterium]|nr:hypothetical protein [Lachnospiraceae bacterium]
MFGYITINKAEMKFKEFDVYHAYYCGLCQSLLGRYGALGQITLSYDMTFAAILLSSLYEPETATRKCVCIAHPFERHEYVSNGEIDYIADMNVLLSLYKCEDDWKDDKKFFRACFGCMLRKSSCKKRRAYREKENRIRDLLDKISGLEKTDSRDIDLISGFFGDIMSEIMAERDDEWKDTLSALGYNLGKFIYILDAYDDIESDIKKNRFNPLKDRYGKPGFDDEIREILAMMMSQCCRQFEMLPVIDNVEILRNILYSGVWGKFEKTLSDRNKKRQQN